MKAAIGFLLVVCVFQSCFSNNEDIITATIPVEKLQEDLTILKNILDSTHAGLYAYNTKQQVDNLFDSISKTITDPLTTAAFYNKVDCIIDRIGCVHSTTQLPKDLYDSLSARQMFVPFPVIAINNRLYMNSNVYTIPLGSEITAMNNWSAQEIISKLSTYNHVDGFRKNKNKLINDDGFAIDYYLAYGAARSFLIRYIPDSGVEKSITYRPEKLKNVYKDLYADTYFFYPDDAPYDLEIKEAKSTAIMSVRTFFFVTYSTRQAFSHFLTNSFRLISKLNIKNLVIDCRNNSGGYYSSTYNLLSYLVPEKLPEYDSAIKRYDVLPYREYVSVDDTLEIGRNDSAGNTFKQLRKGIYLEKEEEINKWEPAKPGFTGKLFLIIDGHVASAASTLASILKDKKRAFVVGEETNGSSAVHNSGAVAYELPNSHLKVDVPTKRYYQPVKKQLPDEGVKPDKFIPVNIRDVIDYYDRPLNFILDSLVAN